MGLCVMSEPNFDTMSYKDLRAYVLAQRDDEKAFHAFADKFHAQPNKVLMPPLKSPEDAENYPDFMEYLRKGSERYHNKEA